MLNTSGVENVIHEYCVGCEDYKTHNCTINCIFNRVRAALKNLDVTSSAVAAMETANCKVCRDKKGRNKEILFDDGRGGLSIADYCPVCGRHID